MPMGTNPAAGRGGGTPLHGGVVVGQPHAGLVLPQLDGGRGEVVADVRQVERQVRHAGDELVERRRLADHRHLPRRERCGGGRGEGQEGLTTSHMTGRH